MTFSYDGNPGASDIAAVRFELNDTRSSSPQFTDEEIAWAILRETGSAADLSAVAIAEGGLFAAAARCLESLAALYAQQADSETGTLKLEYNKAAESLADRAKEKRAKAQGYHAPYAGGLSQSEKDAFAQDTDLVPPRFTRSQFDSPWADSSGSVNRGLGLPPQ